VAEHEGEACVGGMKERRENSHEGEVDNDRTRRECVESTKGDGRYQSTKGRWTVTEHEREMCARSMKEIWTVTEQERRVKSTKERRRAQEKNEGEA